MTGIAVPVLVIAALKIVFGLSAFVAGDTRLDVNAASAVPLTSHLVQQCVFGAAAVLLLWGGRRDERAIPLGGFFLLVASTYSDRPIRILIESVGWQGTLLSKVLSLQPDAFEPWFLWRFSRDFPQRATETRLDQLGRIAMTASLAAGLALFGIECLIAFSAQTTSWARALASTFGRRSPESYYWGIVFVSITAALTFTLARGKQGSAAENRRARLFVVGFAMGLLPVATSTLLNAFVPSYRRIVEASSYVWILRVFNGVALATVPVTTTYAVLVHRVLDVRLVIRRVVQYALARHALTAGVSLPLLAIGVYLFRNREQTVGSLLTGNRVLFLGGASAAAGLLLSFRGQVLDALDRRFFRERYDARMILAGLTRESRRVTRPAEFAALVEVEVERALHPQTVAVLVVDPDSGRLTSSGGALPTLAPESVLAELARTRAEPFDVDLESPAVTTLPEGERRWLADLGVTLVVPLTASEGRLVGLIALGPRKSELPYSREDRQLLADVAASGSIVVENRLIRAEARVPSRGPRPSVPTKTTVDAPDLTPERWSRIKELLAQALEMPTQDRASFVERLEASDPAGARELTSLIAGYQDSDTLLDTSPVLHPTALSPKARLGPYEIQALIGSGGMGRVYRARDTRLGRDVALKVLAAELEDSPRAHRRFEREVRAVASLSHPNILAIHDFGRAGAVDYAVMELLEGETLRAQLERGALPPTSTLDHARQIVRGLVAAHAKGIVHRDLKPENLFLTSEGVVKILDFGLAKRTLPSSSGSVASAVSRPGMLLGTVGYMSPEQVRGEDVDSRSDLFSFGTVCYEMLAGRRAFERATAVETMAAILKDEPGVLDSSQAPAELEAVVRRCLEKDAARRVATASELLAALETIELPRSA